MRTLDSRENDVSRRVSYPFDRFMGPILPLTCLGQRFRPVSAQHQALPLRRVGLRSDAAFCRALSCRLWMPHDISLARLLPFSRGGFFKSLRENGDCRLLQHPAKHGVLQKPRGPFGTPGKLGSLALTKRAKVELRACFTSAPTHVIRWVELNRAATVRERSFAQQTGPLPDGRGSDDPSIQACCNTKSLSH